MAFCQLVKDAGGSTWNLANAQEVCTFSHYDNQKPMDFWASCHLIVYTYGAFVQFQNGNGGSMGLPMGPSVCVKFAHVINETCDRPPFSLIMYANLKKTEQMHCRWAHRHDKHEQLLGRCAQSIFRMCTPTVQLLTLKKHIFANVQTYCAFAQF